MLSSIFSVAQNLGYPALFLLIMAESAGLPTPGETALVGAAILAAQGKLQIGVVIAVAALAAVIGDNLGYLIARKAGRQLMLAPGPFARRRRRVLATGEPFLERHGSKAVFFGRWITGLRTWAAWLAGAVNMPWRSFALWNALGGISWATTIGLAGYLLGQSAGSALSAFAIFGIVTVLVTAASALLIGHRRQRRSSSPCGQDQLRSSTMTAARGDAPNQTLASDQAGCSRRYRRRRRIVQKRKARQPTGA